MVARASRLSHPVAYALDYLPTPWVANVPGRLTVHHVDTSRFMEEDA